MVESYLLGLLVIVAVIAAIYFSSHDHRSDSVPLTSGEWNLMIVAVLAYPIVICLLMLACLGALWDDDTAHHRI